MIKFIVITVALTAIIVVATGLWGAVVANYDDNISECAMCGGHYQTVDYGWPYAFYTITTRTISQDNVSKSGEFDELASYHLSLDFVIAVVPAFLLTCLGFGASSFINRKAGAK